MPTSDQYPGDEAYTRRIQELLGRVRNDNMDFPWHHQQGVSKRQLARELARRHFRDRTNTMTETNAVWMDCSDVTQETLEAWHAPNL